MLRTHCVQHKYFPVCPRARAQHLLWTQILCPGRKKMFLILFRNLLCPQQMFPSLHSPRNFTGNNVFATMCPCFHGLNGQEAIRDWYIFTMKYSFLCNYRYLIKENLNISSIRMHNCKILLSSTKSDLAYFMPNSMI